MSHEPNFPSSDPAPHAKDSSENADGLTFRQLVQDAYVDAPSVDALWQSFATARDAGRPLVADTVPAPRISRSRIPAWYRRSSVLLGSALALCAVVAGVTVWNADGGSDVFRSPGQEYRTPQGQFASLTLPDGSIIDLAPESHIVYQHAESGERRVMLSGQAIFRVVHASVAPFVVATNTTTTRVLGTTFGVREYPGDSNVQVAVKEGRVATGAPNDMAVVNAGHVAIVTDSSVTVTAKQDAGNVVTWANGRVTFANTSVQSLLETLGRWYGYKFHLPDSALAARHVSTVLDLGKPDETLQMIGSLLDVGMTIKGDTVILSGRNADRSPALRLRPTARPVFSTGLEVGK